ncbi:MAG: twin-arginine translocation signal domain-containing protein [bacterium]|nr:twin-arginine translocation signal domain-containing protein [bacterium]
MRRRNKACNNSSRRSFIGTVALKAGAAVVGSSFERYLVAN